MQSPTPSLLLPLLLLLLLLLLPGSLAASGCNGLTNNSVANVTLARGEAFELRGCALVNVSLTIHVALGAAPDWALVRLAHASLQQGSLVIVPALEAGGTGGTVVRGLRVEIERSTLNCSGSATAIVAPHVEDVRVAVRHSWLFSSGHDGCDREGAGGGAGGRPAAAAVVVVADNITNVAIDVGEGALLHARAGGVAEGAAGLRRQCGVAASAALWPLTAPTSSAPTWLLQRVRISISDSVVRAEGVSSGVAGGVAASVSHRAPAAPPLRVLIDGITFVFSNATISAVYTPSLRGPSAELAAAFSAGGVAVAAPSIRVTVHRFHAWCVRQSSLRSVGAVASAALGLAGASMNSSAEGSATIEFADSHTVVDGASMVSAEVDVAAAAAAGASLWSPGAGRAVGGVSNMTVHVFGGSKIRAWSRGDSAASAGAAVFAASGEAVLLAALCSIAVSGPGTTVVADAATEASTDSRAATAAGFAASTLSDSAPLRLSVVLTEIVITSGGYARADAFAAAAAAAAASHGGRIVFFADQLVVAVRDSGIALVRAQSAAAAGGIAHAFHVAGSTVALRDCSVQLHGGADAQAVAAADELSSALTAAGVAVAGPTSGTQGLGDAASAIVLSLENVTMSVEAGAIAAVVKEPPTPPTLVAIPPPTVVVGGAAVAFACHGETVLVVLSGGSLLRAAGTNTTVRVSGDVASAAAGVSVVATHARIEMEGAALHVGEGAAVSASGSAGTAAAGVALYALGSVTASLTALSVRVTDHGTVRAAANPQETATAVAAAAAAVVVVAAQGTASATVVRCRVAVLEGCAAEAVARHCGVAAFVLFSGSDGGGSAPLVSLVRLGVNSSIVDAVDANVTATGESPSGVAAVLGAFAFAGPRVPPRVVPVVLGDAVGTTTGDAVLDSARGGLLIRACWVFALSGLQWPDLASPARGHHTATLGVSPLVTFADQSSTLDLQVFGSALLSQGGCVGVPLLPLSTPPADLVRIVISSLQLACVAGYGTRGDGPPADSVPPGAFAFNAVTDHYHFRTNMTFDAPRWFPPPAGGFAALSTDDDSRLPPLQCEPPPAGHPRAIVVSTPPPPPPPTTAPPTTPPTTAPTTAPTTPPTTAPPTTTSAVESATTLEPIESPTSTQEVTPSPMPATDSGTDGATPVPTPQTAPPLAKCAHEANATLGAVAFDLRGRWFWLLFPDNATGDASLRARAGLVADLEALLLADVCELDVAVVAPPRRRRRRDDGGEGAPSGTLGIAVRVAFPIQQLTPSTAELLLQHAARADFPATRALYITAAAAAGAMADLDPPTAVRPADEPSPMLLEATAGPVPSTDLLETSDAAPPAASPSPSPPLTTAPPTTAPPPAGSPPPASPAPRGASAPPDDGGDVSVVVIAVLVALVLVVVCVVVGVVCGLRMHRRQREKLSRYSSEAAARREASAAEKAPQVVRPSGPHAGEGPFTDLAALSRAAPPLTADTDLAADEELIDVRSLLAAARSSGRAGAVAATAADGAGDARSAAAPPSSVASPAEAVAPALLQAGPAASADAAAQESDEGGFVQPTKKRVHIMPQTHTVVVEHPSDGSSAASGEEEEAGIGGSAASPPTSPRVNFDALQRLPSALRTPSGSPHGASNQIASFSSLPSDLVLPPAAEVTTPTGLPSTKRAGAGGRGLPSSLVRFCADDEWAATDRGDLAALGRDGFNLLATRAAVDDDATRGGGKPTSDAFDEELDEEQRRFEERRERERARAAREAAVRQAAAAMALKQASNVRRETEATRENDDDDDEDEGNAEDANGREELRDQQNAEGGEEGRADGAVVELSIDAAAAAAATVTDLQEVGITFGAANDDRGAVAPLSTVFSSSSSSSSFSLPH